MSSPELEHGRVRRPGGRRPAACRSAAAVTATSPTASSPAPTTSPACARIARAIRCAPSPGAWRRAAASCRSSCSNRAPARRRCSPADDLPSVLPLEARLRAADALGAGGRCVRACATASILPGEVIATRDRSAASRALPRGACAVRGPMMARARAWPWIRLATLRRARRGACAPGCSRRYRSVRANSATRPCCCWPWRSWWRRTSSTCRSGRRWPSACVWIWRAWLTQTLTPAPGTAHDGRAAGGRHRLAVWFEHGTLFGRDASVNFLLVLIGLKLLEMRRPPRRAGDRLPVAASCCRPSSSVDQGLSTATIMAVAVGLLFFVLLSVSLPEGDISFSGKMRLPGAGLLAWRCRWR